MLRWPLLIKPGGFLRSPRLTTCRNILKICYTQRQIKDGDDDGDDNYEDDDDDNVQSSR